MCEREATFIGEPHQACVEPPMEPATYKHQLLSRSLDEIRLLKLRKEKQGPVHCEVEVFPLEQAPEYIALSYRWGPPSPSHDIFIGDQRLKIRDILHACLLELREDVDTWLWIDQICIAQVDTAERNHQVRMMSRIYSNAISVSIWLDDVPLPPPGETDRFNDRDLPESAGELLEHVYFTRLWIVQEIMLGHDIFIFLNGHRRISWRRLQEICDDHLDHEFIPSSLVAPLSLLEYTISYLKDKPTSLMELIATFHKSACANPRDKVYGLMGLVRVEDIVTVDYAKTVLEVYADVVIVAFNSVTTGASLEELRGPLLALGSEMGIEESTIKATELMLVQRLRGSRDHKVTAVDFGQADDPERAWYE